MNLFAAHLEGSHETDGNDIGISHCFAWVAKRTVDGLYRCSLVI
jgi:hypothetical protein